MIDYFKGIYGINILDRVHGSSLYKGSLVGIFSVLIYLAIELQIQVLLWSTTTSLDDPYGVEVLVASVSFLIIFRASNGYGRYWEACGSLHHFMSRWMDYKAKTINYKATLVLLQVYCYHSGHYKCDC